MSRYLLEFPEIVIVEASAGTGKTYELARRYIQLLISPSYRKYTQLSNILAVTFTNKAALEMKERILEFLKKISLNSLSENEKDILKIIGGDKNKIRNKASELMDEIIKHYSFFQVQTIDSLINSFLLSSAINIGRSAGFKIKKDQNQYLRYCFDKIVEEAEKNKTLFSIFEEFLKHYLFVENRRSWFPREDILNLMGFLFSLNNKYGTYFHIDKHNNDDVIRYKEILYNKIKELSLIIPDGMSGRAKKSILDFVESKDRYFSFKDIPNVFKNPQPPMNKGKCPGEDFSRQWSKIVKSVKNLAEMESRLSFKPYIELFSYILEELSDISRGDDILFLEELNNRAHILLSNGMSLPELYYRMSGRFSHYLIDEFQDTSILQWGNLEEMIEDALSSGGTLFCVGDRKQEIYRFRGGETGLFDDIKVRWKRYNVKNRILRKNWRSQKAIVDFNNEVFSHSNLKSALSKMKESNNGLLDIENILTPFSDSRQEYEETNQFGYVHLEIVEGANKKEHSDKIHSELINLISSLRGRSFNYKDIAVLCRDNNEIELVTSWLLEENIPVESEKTLNLKENPLIKEIVSFLKFLDSPLDNISFVSFISGDIFTKACGITPENIIDFIFKLHKNGKLNNDFLIYRAFRREYSDIWNKYIDKFFKSVGFLSPYELVISIYDSFKVMDNFRDSQSFFVKLLEVIKNKEDEYTSLSDFLYYLEIASREDLYVTSLNANSVRILTIHKSKGLEFSVVIIPFLHIKPKPGEGEADRANAFVNICEEDSSIELLRLTKDYIKYSNKLKDIYKEAYIKSMIDELNAVYVAFTRAKLELYVFIPDKIGNSPNKAKYLIDNIPREWGSKRSYKIEGERQTVNHLSVQFRQNWMDFLKDELIKEPFPYKRARVIEGEIMHFVLSCIKNVSGSDIPLVNKALMDAKAKYPFFKRFDSIERKTKSVINSSSCRKFFFVENALVWTEKDIIDLKGNYRRIDRLIVFDKEAWVIDYKTSRSSEDKDRKQVREYVEAVKNIYPQKDVKGFLLYMDSIEVEEI